MPSDSNGAAASYNTAVSKLVDTKPSDDLVVPNLIFNRCPKPWR